ncbi:hypothetical protein WCU98_19560, partial [Pectobacterium parmentieri]|uniref:hypothetical protein n=1 Tax=Pectobacterium parmentieri TaxID=1905730 RepID=UPI0030178E7B
MWSFTELSGNGLCVQLPVLSFFICLSGFLWCWHRVPDLCGRRRAESGQNIVNKAKMRQCRDEAGLRGQVADIIAA